MNKKQQRISKLNCIGPASERMLTAIGTTTRDELLATGPVQAYLELEQLPRSKPSLNLLYSVKLALDIVD